MNTTKYEIEKVYSLSPMQKGMLFVALEEGRSDLYIEQLLISVSSELDVELLNESYNLLIQRHDVLRTIFVASHLKEPRQVVIKHRSSKIGYYDLREREEQEQKEFIKAFTLNDIDRGFNVTSDRLMRMSVLQIRDTEHCIVFTFHHIILDGWSFSKIIEEMLMIYNMLKRDVPVALPHTSPFSNYIRWIQEQNNDAALKYWKEYLSDYEQQLQVVPGLDKARTDSPQVGDYLQQEYQIQISANDAERLREVSIRNNVSLGTAVKVIWGILLQKYNNTEDVVFGNVINGRSLPLPDIDNMVGLLVNTVPMRIRSNADLSIKDLICSVHEEMYNIEKYGYMQLGELQSLSFLNRQLINHIFAIEYNYSNDSLKGNTDFQIDDITYYEKINYDFNVFANISDGMTFRFQFNALVYDEKSIQRMGGHLAHIIAQIAANPKMAVRHITLLPKEECNYLLLSEKNTLLDDIVQESGLIELFEAQAMNNPKRIAVTFHQEEITYEQLNVRVNQLANHLKGQYNSSNPTVAILMDRSIELLISIFAVMKSGAAFLPLDPKLPDERIHYMLDDSESSILLINNIEQSYHLDYDAKIINVKELLREPGLESQNPELPYIGHGTSYVLYTSGSTGTPKGVIIDNSALRNFYHAFISVVPMEENSSIAALTTISFDISIVELVVPLLSGMKIILAGENHQNDPEELMKLLTNQKVNVLQSTPSRLQTIVDHPKFEDLPLREIILGGESFPKMLLYKLRGKTKASIFNGYGPTEATIYALIKNLTHEEHITIGTPLPNTYAYITDRYMNPMPIGVIGELCLTGSSIAKGYLHREGQTAEKFVTDSSISDSPIYKTGDLARRLPNGDFEYLGRNDFQVKVRGVRIETQEIEYCLIKHEDIVDAAVIPLRDEEDKTYLCAYYVADYEMTPRMLRSFLLRWLPEYMVPSRFVMLDKLPLTASGKTDRLHLPEPLPLVHDTSSDSFNSIENRMAELWCDVLGVEKIGKNLNFFELGGHSLKAMSLLTLIRKEWKTDLTMHHFFDIATIEQTADYILESQQMNSLDDITPASQKAMYPAAAAQKRLYILERQFDDASDSYHMPVIARLDGNLDENKIEVAFNKLIERHEVLRTTFQWVNNDLMQFIEQKADFQMARIKGEEEKIDEIINDFLRPFDLKKAPLLRVALIEVERLQHYLVVDMPHIIVDGASLEIMMYELTQLYNGENPQPIPIQFKDYCVWMDNYMESGRLDEQEQYWMNVFSKSLPQADLLPDFPRSAILTYKGANTRVILERELCEQIQKLTKETGTTPYMFFMSAYTLLLSKYTQQSDIVVGSPISGRTHPDAQSLIGLFANTIPLRFGIREDERFVDYLQTVKRITLNALDNQDYPFDRLISKLQLNRMLNRNPLFDTMLSMSNVDYDKGGMSGLKISPYSIDTGTSKFDLSLWISEMDGCYVIDFQYKTDLFKAETIDNFKKYLIRIIHSAVSNPNENTEFIELIQNSDFKNKPNGMGWSEKNTSLDIEFNL